MTHILENARLADEPIEVRREAENARQREISDGLASCHLAITREERAFAAVNFATLLRVAPALAAQLRGS